MSGCARDPAPSCGSGSAQGPGGAPAILVADDDPVSRRMLAALLQAWGHAAEAVSDGEEAWASLARRPAPLIAVLDLVMPGLDGLELCRRVRATPRLRGSYLILLTGRSGPSSVVEGLEAGADDFLSKPFDRLELRARVQSGLRVLGLQAELAARVAELEAATQAVDRLQGLLPICCSCKKIRDGNQYWRQVEDYVSERSAARFSHGLCPDCLGREVAELAEERA